MNNKFVAICLVTIFLIFKVEAQERTSFDYNWIVQPQYDFIGPFDEGLAPFSQNKRFGFLDQQGKVIIKPEFLGYIRFSEGLAGVEIEGESRGLQKDSKWGFINPSGEFDISPAYSLCAPFSNGIAGVKVNEKYGFVDKKGELIIEPQFKYVYNVFTEGLMALATLNSKFGFIDNKGTMILPADYTGANPFSEGLASVKKEYNWGYIDKKGTEIIPMEFEQALSFKNGVAKVQKFGKWGYIDKGGHVIIELEYDEIGQQSQGLVAALKGGKWGYFDLHGKQVLKPRFDDAGYFSDGLAPVKINGKWGYVNQNDSMVVVPQFESASSFSDGYAKFRKGGKWGYLNSEGKIILDPQFDDASEIKDLYARVRKTGKWGVILFRKHIHVGYVTLKGKIVDAKTQLPLSSSTVSIINLSNGKTVQQISVNERGHYTSSPLSYGTQYGIFVNATGYIAENQNYGDTTVYKIDKVVTKDIRMVHIENNALVQLNNIFFEFGKAALTPLSATELDLLVTIMKANPTMHIEIHGHTDNKGAVDKNLQVSKDRAQTIKSYLFKKGIAENRLKAIGYGDTKPIASNSTEEGRTKNRRVEYKITQK